MRLNIFRKKSKKKEEKKIEKHVETNKKQVVKPDQGKAEVVSQSKIESEQKKSEIAVKKNAKIAYKILFKPLITEKAMNMQAFHCYAFEVSPRANKISVSQAIKELYGIKPKKIHIINVKGKKVRYGKNSGKTKGRKKAIVFLNKNQKIEFIKK